MPPAVTILPSAAITSVPGPTARVTPGWMSGLPALPMPTMRPCLTPMSALTMPQWSMISALVSTRSMHSADSIWPWPMPSRITLPPPNLTSSP
ncbi:hypothetical protein D3C75_1220560 [compost metagenome]